MAGETRSKVEDLRITIPFQQFKDKVTEIIGLGDELRKRHVSNVEDLHEFEELVKSWYQSVISLLKNSFNTPYNHLEQQFSQDYKELELILTFTPQSFAQRALDKKAKLMDAIKGLKAKTSILSVCDAIINYDQTQADKIRSLNNTDKLTLILKKLYKLPSQGFYPVQEILNGNGLVIDQRGTLGLTSILEKEGLVKMLRSKYAFLTMEGKLWVEQNGIEPKQEKNMTQEKIGKIFISHATADQAITSQFTSLILGNVFNISHKNIFNTSHVGTKPYTGEDFRTRIKKELEESSIIFQFISPAYKASEVCLIEMGAAWVLSDNVIPLIVEKGKYDVGFIHSANQQAQLHNKGHLLKAISDLMEQKLLPQSRADILANKVEEFVNWLNKSEVESIVPVSGEPSENDLKMITNYMDAKRYSKMSLDSVRKNIHHKFTDDFILKLIEKFPDDLTRTVIQGKPGIHNLFPDFDSFLKKI